jgi:hypothetical protein
VDVKSACFFGKANCFSGKVLANSASLSGKALANTVCFCGKALANAAVNGRRHQNKNEYWPEMLHT